MCGDISIEQRLYELITKMANGCNGGVELTLIKQQLQSIQDWVNAFNYNTTIPNAAQILTTVPVASFPQGTSVQEILLFLNNKINTIHAAAVLTSNEAPFTWNTNFQTGNIPRPAYITDLGGGELEFNSGDGSTPFVFTTGGGTGNTDLGIANRTSTTLDVTSSTGNDATLPSASNTEAGLMSAADKFKLSGIAAGAEVNVNADWNAVSGDAQILNKPNIPSVTGLASISYVDAQDNTKQNNIQYQEEGSNLGAAGTVNTVNFTGAAVTASRTGNVLTVDVTASGGGGEANTASNVGVSGVGVFKQKTGTNLEFKNINSGSNKVTVTNDAANSEIDVDVVVANLTGIAQSQVTNLETDLAGKHPAMQFQDEGSNLGSSGTITTINYTGTAINTSRVGNVVTVNVDATAGVTNLSVGNRTATTLDVISDTGTDATLPFATTSLAGLLTSADKTKLDGIATGANLYAHPNHSGDVVSVADGATTIQAGVVTNTKLATMGANTIKGTNVGGSPLDLSVSQVKTILGFTAADITNTPAGNIAATNVQTALNELDGEKNVNILFQEEGTDLGTSGTVNTLNFTGANITASRAGNVVTVDVTGGSGGGVTNLTYSSASSSGTVNSDTGTDATIPAATTSIAGLLTSADKTKLDGIATGANLYVHPNHSGDVTSVADGATTISANAVTFPKFQQISTATLLGRSTAGTGNVEAITLGVGLTLSSGVLSSTIGTVTSVGISGSDFTIGSSPVTTSGTITLAIANNAVTNAKLAQAPANTLKGNNTGVTANEADLTVAQVKTLLSYTATEVANTAAGNIASTTVQAAINELDGEKQVNLQFQEEGTNLGTSGTVNVINFTGATITASRSGNTLTVDVAGGGGGGATNLSVANRTSTTLDVASDTGTDATIPQASTTEAGLLTASDKVKLNSTTGTNTGDQTSIVGITGTKAQFDTAVTDGNFLYVGDISQYTDELAQDAIGAMVDSTLVYVDGTPLFTRAALTGDVIASQGSNATTITNNVVTNAKLAQASALTLKGNNTGGTANVADLTASQVKTMLAIAGSDVSNTPSGSIASTTVQTALNELDGEKHTNIQFQNEGTNLSTAGTVDVINFTGLAINAVRTGNTLTVDVSATSGVTNLGYTPSSLNGTVTSDTGSDATIPLVTGTEAGLLSPTDYTKIGNITITQPVNLDTLESDTVTNNAKVTNATHTGDATGATVLTLATVNSNVGSFGSATQVGTFTVNGKGLITAAGNVTITPAASSITGAGALTKVDDTNVTLTLGGTPTTALLAATSLTLGWTGTLADSRITSAATWNSKQAGITFKNEGSALGTTATAIEVDFTGTAVTASRTGNVITVDIAATAGTTNLSYTASSTNGIIVCDTGSDATIPAADGTNAGLMLPAQFTKLSNISITQPVDLDALEADVADLTTLSGVASNATTLGTFTGTTIPDSSTVKAALQSLETALEANTGASPLENEIRVVSVNTTLSTTTDGTVVFDTAGTVATLPSPTNKKQLVVKNVSTGNITVTGHLDGVAAQTFTIASLESYRFHSNGSTFYIIS